MAYCQWTRHTKHQWHGNAHSPSDLLDLFTKRFCRDFVAWSGSREQRFVRRNKIECIHISTFNKYRVPCIIFKCTYGICTTTHTHTSRLHSFRWFALTSRLTVWLWSPAMKTKSRAYAPQNTCAQKVTLTMYYMHGQIVNPIWWWSVDYQAFMCDSLEAPLSLDLYIFGWIFCISLCLWKWGASSKHIHRKSQTQRMRPVGVRFVAFSVRKGHAKVHRRHGSPICSGSRRTDAAVSVPNRIAQLILHLSVVLSIVLMKRSSIG